MATINERANGRFTAMVRRAGQKQQFRTFDTRKEAEDWAAVTEGRIIARRQAGNGATPPALVTRGRAAAAPAPIQDRTCTWTLDDGLAWYEERYTGTKSGEKKERTRIAWLRRHRLAQSFMDQVSVSGAAASRTAGTRRRCRAQMRQASPGSSRSA